MFVTLRDGERHETRAAHCVGSRAQPMSDARLEQAEDVRTLAAALVTG